MRAFVDWMLDVLNEQGMFDGRALVVQPIGQGMARQLNEQDGLYTVILRGIEGGKVSESRRLITSVSRGLNPVEDWPAVVGGFCQPEVRFVFSNTTEAGIAWLEEPFVSGRAPASFPAKVAALLYERFVKLGGDAAKGLIFFPCELIEQNGANLKSLVLKHAESWKLGAAFSDWVEKRNYFLNTLVDRIVPGYPAAEAAGLCAELGYEDRLLDAAEIFHLWVIEGPQHLADELPFHKAGLNVIWTDDMKPYRTRKVRILNGAHTASVLAAFHSGLNTVQEMMEDVLLGRFVRQVVFEEIVPTVPLPEEERRKYAEAVLERFGNPFIKHELLSIALNSVSKWKVRVLPSLLDHLKSRGQLPPALTFSLAALIHFYRGAAGSPRELTGTRNGMSYAIRDDQDVLRCFETAWRKFDQDRDVRALTETILANESLWGMNLVTLPGFADAVASHLEHLGSGDIRSRIIKVVKD